MYVDKTQNPYVPATQIFDVNEVLHLDYSTDIFEHSIVWLLDWKYYYRIPVLHGIDLVVECPASFDCWVQFASGIARQLA